MSRLPEISTSLNENHKCWSLLSCLNTESLVNLEAAIYYNHRQHVLEPKPEVDIMPFDAEKEVKQSPNSENHMRAT